MTDRLILDDLCKAMHVAYVNHMKDHYYEPKMLVTFSYDGLLKARACAEAVWRFSTNSDNVQTVNGYPLMIEREQKEDFIVHVTNVKRCLNDGQRSF